MLVNNAGIYKFAPLDQITEEQFHSQFGTNVLGLILATQEAAKHFDGSGGSVINIGSAITSQTPPNTAVYTATKGAVDVITRTLAKELGPRKIRVNSINPGVVETEGTHTAGFIGSDFQKSLEGQTPLGRIGQSDDIAPVAVFPRILGFGLAHRRNDFGVRRSALKNLHSKIVDGVLLELCLRSGGHPLHSGAIATRAGVYYRDVMKMKWQLPAAEPPSRSYSANSGLIPGRIRSTPYRGPRAIRSLIGTLNQTGSILLAQTRKE